MRSGQGRWPGREPGSRRPAYSAPLVPPAVSRRPVLRGSDLLPVDPAGDRSELCLVAVAPCCGLLVSYRSSRASCRGPMSPCVARSAFDDPVGYAANPLDLDCDRIAGVQEHGWFPTGPDALRGASSDEIAGLERHRARRVGSDFGAGEDEIRRVAVLDSVAVYVRLDAQLIGVWDFVSRNDPRAERS